MCSLRIGLIAPIAWPCPPKAYGPWEQVCANLAKGLFEAGVEVTVFASADSGPAGRLHATVPRGYEDDPSQDAKVNEYTHLAEVFAHAHKFDLLHSHFDFMPLLAASMQSVPLVVTIHGFSSERIVPLYKRFEQQHHYVAISEADRHPDLRYAATVYNGIQTEDFGFGCVAGGAKELHGPYLLFLGRIHPDKGPDLAIEMAERIGLPLLMAGLIQDRAYWEELILPKIDGQRVKYLGNIGSLQRKQVLAEAEAMLHPIRFEEPFGLSVAESIISGTPVIAFRKGSMPELVKAGISGVLIEDVEEAAAAFAKTRQIDRARCREWGMERFGLNRMTEEDLTLYHRILQRD